MICYPKFSKKTAERINGVMVFAKDNKESGFYKYLSDAKIARQEDFKLIPAVRMKQVFDKSDRLRHYPETEIRYLSSEFYPEKVDSLFLFPLHYKSIWRSLDNEFKLYKPDLAMIIVPFFWQTGPVFYKTARKNKIPVAVQMPKNLPVARQIMKEVSGRWSITTTSGIAGEFEKMLMEKGLGKDISFWHIVSSLEENKNFIPALVKPIFTEKHLFPGVILAYQCENISHERRNVFHPSKDYFWIFEKGKARITSLNKDAFPFINYEIKFPVKIREESCGCGENVLLSF